MTLADRPDSDPLLGFATRSLLDNRVWVAHIPDTDIATSEPHAGGMRAVKDYVQQWNADRGMHGYWLKDGPDTWVLRENETVGPGS